MIQNTLSNLLVSRPAPTEPPPWPWLVAAPALPTCMVIMESGRLEPKCVCVDS